MIAIRQYDLPDAILIDPDAPEESWFFWNPDQPYLILGQSNKPEESLFVDKVLRDNIPVYKRPSGGESVILTNKTLVIAVRLISNKLENPQVYFKKINNAIISGLETLGVGNLLYKGISDIAIGEKKILGSSIYRKKHMVFYHAVLNISEDIDLIGKYLKHPGKEPDYRQGRMHSEFVTNLLSEGYPLNPSNISQSLTERFRSLLKREFTADF